MPVRPLPQPAESALLHLTGERTSAIREALDPFHPSLGRTPEILDAMERDTVKEHACAALLSGKSNLAIAGQTLQ